MKMTDQELTLASELLNDAQLLLDKGSYRSSVSRSYYAAYHACIALLESFGLEPHNFLGKDGRPARRWEHGIVISEVATNASSVNVLSLPLAIQVRWQYSLRIRADYQAAIAPSAYSVKRSYEAASEIITKVEGQLK